MSPADSGFRDLNVLGTDFCASNRLYLAYDYKNSVVKLSFSSKQEVPPTPLS